MLLCDIIESHGDQFCGMKPNALASLRGDLALAQKFVLDGKFAVVSDQLGMGSNTTNPTKGDHRELSAGRHSRCHGLRIGMQTE